MKLFKNLGTWIAKDMILNQLSKVAETKSRVIYVNYLKKFRSNNELS